MINYDEKEYEEATAYTGEYTKLLKGGYVCKILDSKVEKSRNGNEMLVLHIDIDEGEFKDYFSKQYESRVKTSSADKIAKYPNSAILRTVLSGDNWINRFKGIITSIEKSNQGFNWKECNKDESKLIGLKVGAIFSEEEYKNMDGTVGISVKLYQLRSTEAIKNQDYKIPERKKLPAKGDAFEDFVNSATSDSNDDLPF